MRRGVSMLAAAAWVLSGCGGGGGPALAPPPAGHSPAPPTAGPAPGGGTGPGGGAEPAGALALPADRSVAIERLDPDPECDALVPSAVPAPVYARIRSAAAACGRGISEGGGHVALGRDMGDGWWRWHVFSGDGHAEEVMPVWLDTLVPQPAGWQAAWDTGSRIPVPSVLTFSATGAIRASVTPDPPLALRSFLFTGDPRGGALLVLNGLALAGGPPCAGEARRLAGDGAATGAPGPVGCLTLAAGVARSGEALVVDASAGRSILHWLRPDGSPARAPADEGDLTPIFGSGGPVRLVPLLDGSLATQSGDRWIRRYPLLADRGEAAPAWLASRSGWSYRFTRGDRGYAFFRRGGEVSPDCTQVAELVASSGRRCARLTFREDGADCTTGAIDQGPDGTVVQQSGRDACAYRWWPALLGE